MVRILNFFCVALMGLTILALYHVSEKTRVAHMELARSMARSPRSRAHTACWKPNGSMSPRPSASSNWRRQRLGMADTASVQLSSFEQLPRRGDDPAPLNNTPLHNASAQVPQRPRRRPQRTRHVRP